MTLEAERSDHGTEGGWAGPWRKPAPTAEGEMQELRLAPSVLELEELLRAGRFLPATWMKFGPTAAHQET